MKFHKWSIGILGVLIGFTIAFLKIENRSEIWKVKYSCVADSCLVMMEPLEYTVIVVPLLMIAVILATRGDFNGNRILFYRSKMELFLMQVGKGIRWSLFITFFYLLTILVYQMWNGQSIYNWDAKNSYFCIMNKEVFAGTGIEVFAGIFLLCMCRNLIISMVIILSEWYFRHMLVGFLMVLSVCIFELAQIEINVPIFLKRLSVNAVFWLSQSKRTEVACSIGVYLLILCFLVKRVVEKKEFLDETFGKKSNSPGFKSRNQQS